MGCCANIIRYLFIIFNVIFFLIGTIILGVGIWLKVSKDSLYNFMSKVNLKEQSDIISQGNAGILDVAAIFMIIFGVLTFIIGFCGCCGAWKQSRCLLMIYAALVVVIILAEIGFSVYAAVQKSKTKEIASSNLKKLIEKDFNGYLTNKPTAFTLMFTSVMTSMKCCGINGIDDFKTNKTWNKPGNKNPIGCCTMKDGKTISASMDKKKSTADVKKMMANEKCFSQEKIGINKDGCIDKFVKIIEKNINLVIGICVGFGVLEITMVIIACFVARKDDSTTA